MAIPAQSPALLRKREVERPHHKARRQTSLPIIGRNNTGDTLMGNQTIEDIFDSLNLGITAGVHHVSQRRDLGNDVTQTEQVPDVFVGRCGGVFFWQVPKFGEVNHAVVQLQVGNGSFDALYPCPSARRQSVRSERYQWGLCCW